MTDINDEMSQEDDALLQRLGQAIADTDTVPPWLTRFAKESHRLVSFEGELAEIVSDSLVNEPAGTRSTGGLRTIEFAVNSVTIRLEVEGDELRGSVSPMPSELLLVSETDEQQIQVNSRGFFTIVTPSGLVRLVATVGTQVVRTDWVRFS